MFLNYLFLFFLGSVLGWIIEFIYRSITNKKIYFPGFLNGFYLPIYGFGIIILYFISNINVYFIYKVILFFILLTALEYITGIIFIKFFKIKLWDYNDMPFNYKGLICLRFSIYWTIFGILFYLFLYPFLYSLSIIATNIFFIDLLLFCLLFIFSIDVFISFKLLYKLKKLRIDLKLKIMNFNYIKFRNKIRKYIKNKSLEKYFLSQYNKNKKQLIYKISKLLNNK